ncbi:MAG: SixA phosphatase family protein [Candidatus Neomarinimicrobiota bacterium]
MKSLFLTRHAKSSWDHPGLSDIDRPLNSRGKKAAPRMGELIHKKKDIPNILISSPAHRAFSTAKAFAETFGYLENDIIINNTIYGAGPYQLLDIVKAQDDLYHSIMLFGHNPTFTTFANMLSNENIFNVVTCGVVRIDFNIQNWVDIDYGSGSMIYYEYPKKHIKQ